MFYLLDYETSSQSIIESCGNSAIANLISIIKTALDVIQIMGPIICIIALALNFTKLMANPDEKKHKAALKNSALALIILFAVPFIVNLTMTLANDSFDLATCWNHAQEISSLGEDSKYVDTNDNPKQDIITKPGDYDTPDVNPGNNNNNNNNSNNNSQNQQLSKRVFLGDSRTVQMYAYLTDDWSGANYSSGGVHTVGNDIFIAQGAQGLNWLKQTGIPAANSYFTSGTVVIILMGVNDLTNADNYITYINSNVANWTKNGAKIYFSAVTPCSGGYSHLNSKIKSFNSKVKQGINSKVGWIDTYSYLESSGYSTTDGLHYDKATSDKIYNYVKQQAKI